MKNIYYDPEEFGLTTVATYETGGSYEFCATVVFKSDSGALFWAFDSGCSCPTPFEDHDLTTVSPLTKDTWDDFVKAIEENHYNRDTSEEVAFLSKVRAMLPRRKPQ